MIRLAIIEDQSSDRDHLSALVREYAEFSGNAIEIVPFESALRFLDGKEKYDIILLDIMMPGYNGMEMAHRLRQYDENTEIIFVTSMKQYAIEGYSVDASGFLVKPATYPKLKAALDKALRNNAQKHTDVISVRTCTELLSVEVSAVEYLEVRDHKLILHTQKGTLETKGTLKEWGDKLEKYHFLRPNNYALVNARHIRSIRDNTLVMPSGVLEISRRKKQDFIDAYLRYAGGIEE